MGANNVGKLWAGAGVGEEKNRRSNLDRKSKTGGEKTSMWGDQNDL